MGTFVEMSVKRDVYHNYKKIIPYLPTGAYSAIWQISKENAAQPPPKLNTDPSHLSFSFHTSV